MAISFLSISTTVLGLDLLGDYLVDADLVDNGWLAFFSAGGGVFAPTWVAQADDGSVLLAGAR